MESDTSWDAHAHYQRKFSQYGPIGDVLPIISKASVDTGEFVLQVTVTHKRVTVIPNTLVCRGRSLCKDEDHTSVLVVPLDICSSPKHSIGSSISTWRLFGSIRTCSTTVQVNGKWSHAFALSRSDCQDCPPSVLLYSLLLESLLRRLSHNSCSPALHGICLHRGARARVSANADEVSTFVSCHRNIEVV